MKQKSYNGQQNLILQNQIDAMWVADCYDAHPGTGNTGGNPEALMTACANAGFPVTLQQAGGGF